MIWSTSRAQPAYVAVVEEPYTLNLANPDEGSRRMHMCVSECYGRPLTPAVMSKVFLKVHRPRSCWGAQRPV